MTFDAKTNLEILVIDVSPSNQSFAKKSNHPCPRIQPKDFVPKKSSLDIDAAVRSYLLLKGVELIKGNSSFSWKICKCGLLCDQMAQ